MSIGRYARVVVLHGTFDEFTRSLAALAGPGIDVGVVQVGVRDAIVRPHLLRLLRSRNPGHAESTLLKEAGAHEVAFLDEDEVAVLLRHRVESDLEPRVAVPVPAEAGGPSWYLHEKGINIEPAWSKAGGAGGASAIDWQGIRVGQLDTGYTRHRALGHGQPGGSWIAAAECRTIMASDLPPEMEPPVPQPNDGIDPMPGAGLFGGHGTRIGATISGHVSGPDDGSVFRGAAPRVPHVVVRITDSVAINNRQFEFAEGLRYLVDVAKVDVVNVSLGVFPPVASPAMKEAVAWAHSRGVIVVCAAGNHLDPVVQPARLAQTIAVGGVTWESLPWHGSAYGRQVDFSAPAADVQRPLAVRTGTGTGFDEEGNGTSYAAALTTGSAALWLRCWAPQIKARYGRTGARVEAFRKAVRATVRKPPGWQPGSFGEGILDTGRLCTEEALALP